MPVEVHMHVWNSFVSLVMMSFFVIIAESALSST